MTEEEVTYEELLIKYRDELHRAHEKLLIQQILIDRKNAEILTLRDTVVQMTKDVHQESLITE